jgi:sugar lactone lactonase YvrE
MDTTPLLSDLVFPEGPRWRDGRLVFSDMHAHRVIAVDPQGRAETLVETPGACSGLGWDPKGRMLVVSMDDHRLLRWDAGTLETAADLSSLAMDAPINDMLVDADGRAYIGQFGFDIHQEQEFTKTDLLVVEPDGTTGVAAGELAFPNGMVLTPDGGTLIVAETYAARLTAFDRASDGSLSNRREWAKLEGAVPDGVCLDAEGCVWVASPVSNQFLRVREGGEVTDRVSVDQMAIACMLGGEDGRTLFGLTAPTVAPDETRRVRGSRIETARVATPGAGLP